MKYFPNFTFRLLFKNLSSINASFFRLIYSGHSLICNFEQDLTVHPLFFMYRFTKKLIYRYEIDTLDISREI